MTDNIFEIETTALAHVACAPQDSGVLLTDFAAAYPGVNHSWIFSVLENTGLPDFLCRFFTKHLQGQHYTQGICGSRRRTIVGGQRCTTRFSCEWLSFCNGLRPDLPMAPRIRIIPKNVDNFEFLQPTQCAYADDLAFASSSFRELMFALAPAFRSIDCIAGLNFNYRKC